MRERIRQTLDLLTRDREREGAWLNTLSLLEYIGARKIGRSAAAHHPSREVLGHWADETRHAAIFKALAADLLKREPSRYVAEAAAKTYFYQLDAALTEWVAAHARANVFVSYLLVTTIIERRAMTLYPLYRAATSHPHIKEALARIIVEEQSHRVDIEDRCRDLLKGTAHDVFLVPLSIEEGLFDAFWSVVEGEATASPEAFLFLPAEAATSAPSRSSEEDLP